MVGKTTKGLVIPSGELWKLKDICGLARTQIKELEKKGVTAFSEHKQFLHEIMKKIEEVKK